MAWQSSEKSGSGTVDVVIIGAGISGINFAYRLQEKNPDLNYVILEGRHEIGGTWSLFNYPGIRSDSDLYTFGFAWNPWTERAAIAQGDLIKNYVKESARLYGIDKKIQYHTMVDSAAYSSADKTWTLSTTVNGKPSSIKTHFMLLGTGYYDYHNPLETTIPGLDNFKGQVLHPQFWPDKLDYAGKDVVIIGSGATAITVLPVMAKTAKHVTMLQRSPSYVVSVPSQDVVERLTARYLSWWPSLRSTILRAKWIFMSLFITTLSAKFPARIKRRLMERVQAELPASIPRDPHFTPKYFPWQQRMCMCPDGDFFEALRAGQASVETGVISTVTSNAIKLTSGRELQPDIIVTATGLKLRFAGGIKLTVDNKPFDIPSKFIWKGLMLEDLPNCAFSFGYVDASWTLGADATAQTVCRILQRMRAEGVAEVTPRRSDDEKAHMGEQGLLRLNSTYVSKAASITPKAGDRGQWIPRSHYLKDIWNAWYGDIETNLVKVKA